MQIKIHSAYRQVVALADTNLIGKTFTQGIKQIEVKPTFFQDKEVNKEEAIQTLKNQNNEDATFYIVGEESIQTALEAGIIKQEGISKIDNIPIALGLF